jgi:hypothetical protein
MIDAFKASGHDVICITSRPRSVLAIPEIPVRVYYADCQPKLEFANENGLAVDVWVDDMPWCIGGPQT